MIRCLGIYSAFHRDPRYGNSAAIFSGQEQDPESMQAKVREAGTAVGVFLEVAGELPSVRYFTAADELPYCVHGTLCLARHLLPEDGEKMAVRTPHMKVCLVRRPSACFCSAVVPMFQRAEPFDDEALMAALGLSDEDLRHTVRVVDAGSPKALVELADAARLADLHVDSKALAAWSRNNSVAGAYIHFDHGNGRYAARSFNPRTGIDEDRATGVAAAALMFAVSGEHRQIEISQGADPATACTIQAFIEGGSVWVGGIVNPFVQEKASA